MIIEGIYVTTMFRNSNNNYTIFKLMKNGASKLVICKGYISPDQLLCPLELDGDYIETENGQVFVIKEAKQCFANRELTVSYLKTNVLNTLANDKTEAVINTIGPDIYNFFSGEDAVSILTKKAKISVVSANRIVNKIKNVFYFSELTAFFQNLGASAKEIDAVSHKYKQEAITAFKKNPYSVALVCDFPFRIPDLYSKQNGITAYNKTRLEYIFLFVLWSYLRSRSNTYMTLEQVINGFKYIIRSQSAFTDSFVSVTQILSVAYESNKIEIEKGSNGEYRFYIRSVFKEEQEISENISNIERGKHKSGVSSEKMANYASCNLKISYSEKQKECFKFITGTGIKVITGGPGTGKSTIINGLLCAYSYFFKGKQIALMAPTGRAAQRVTEVTGKLAQTIHKSLNILPYGEKLGSSFERNFPADLIIIDEASMIDNSLLNAMLKAFKPNALIIFVGDIDQLPSIGAGNVLKSLIGSLECVKLDVNYRQKGNTTIINNAITVNNGSAELKPDKNFKIIKCNNAQEINDVVFSEVKKRYSPKDPFAVQVLSSVKKGKAGIKHLNQCIQTLNESAYRIENKDNRFKIGDKVMMTVNNYDDDYFNGDMGTIVDVNEVSMEIAFYNEHKTIPLTDVHDMELAYATTVHKSQGSEFGTVIIALPKEPENMLTKNILYTAITRAKKEVVLVVEDTSIDICVSKSSENTNHNVSALEEKIKTVLEAQNG